MANTSWKAKAEKFLRSHLDDDNYNAEEAAVYFLSRGKKDKKISNTISNSIERWRNDNTQWSKKSLNNHIRAASILRLIQWGEIGALKKFRDNICNNLDIPNSPEFHGCFQSHTSTFFPLIFPLFMSDIAVNRMSSKLNFLLHQWQQYLDDLWTKSTSSSHIDNNSSIKADQILVTLISAYIFGAYRLPCGDIDSSYLDKSIQCLLDSQLDCGLWGYDQTLPDSEEDDSPSLGDFVNSQKHVVLVAMAIHALFLTKPFGGKGCLEKAAGWLLEQQQADGGWYHLGNPKYSYQVHTTVMVLDALELAEGGDQLTFKISDTPTINSKVLDSTPPINIDTVNVTINNSPAKKPVKETKTKAFAKDRKFNKWENSKDAAFLFTDNDRIKFRYNEVIKDLRLGHNTRYYELMLLLHDNELTSDHIKRMKKICPTPKTKPSEVVRQANESLNKQIRKIGYTDIPENVKFIGLDELTKKYRYYIAVENDYEYRQD